MLAIVFDLFRTLVDPESVNPTAYKRTDRMAAILGADPIELHDWWLASKRDRNISRSPALKERLRIYCSEKLGKQVDGALLSSAIFEADRFAYEAVRNPHREVLQVLSDLRQKRMKIGILSNCDEDEIRYLPESPIVPLVDSVALSLDMGIMKPDPLAYGYILEKLGNTPDQAIFVGDGENQELEGAKRAGFAKVIFMKQFVAHTGFHSKEKLHEFEKTADMTINDIRDLPSVA